jgi:diguanylate cyclase (GGDEF)-like protein
MAWRCAAGGVWGRRPVCPGECGVSAGAAARLGLTGLANRRGLEQLVRERRGRRAFAALAIDVDKLKAVNDHRGHAAGDDLLIVVADAIGRSLRDGDVLARVGGDEFIAISFDADEVSASTVAQRMLDSVAAAHTGELQPRISIGVARGCQHDDSATVLRQADVALYEAKRRGGARYERADTDAVLPAGPERRPLPPAANRTATTAD